MQPAMQGLEGHLEHRAGRPQRKDGKKHRYWSIVESRRCAGGRVVQHLAGLMQVS